MDLYLVPQGTLGSIHVQVKLSLVQKMENSVQAMMSEDGMGDRGTVSEMAVALSLFCTSARHISSCFRDVVLSSSYVLSPAASRLQIRGEAIPVAS